jgi:hypothetical protein
MDVKYDDLRVSETTLDLLDRFEENSNLICYYRIGKSRVYSKNDV